MRTRSELAFGWVVPSLGCGRQQGPGGGGLSSLWWGLSASPCAGLWHVPAACARSPAGRGAGSSRSSSTPQHRADGAPLPGRSQPAGLCWAHAALKEEALALKVSSLPNQGTTRIQHRGHCHPALCWFYPPLGATHHPRWVLRPTAGSPLSLRLCGMFVAQLQVQPAAPQSNTSIAELPAPSSSHPPVTAKRWKERNYSPLNASFFRSEGTLTRLMLRERWGAQHSLQGAVAPHGAEAATECMSPSKQHGDTEHPWLQHRVAALPLSSAASPPTSSQCHRLQRDVVSSSWAVVHMQDTEEQEPAKAPHDEGTRLSHPQASPNPEKDPPVRQQPVPAGHGH